MLLVTFALNVAMTELLNIIINFYMIQMISINIDFITELSIQNTARL